MHCHKHTHAQHLERVVLAARIPQRRHCFLQRRVDGRFAAAGRTDEHDAETHVERVVELNDLGGEDLGRLARRKETRDEGTMSMRRGCTPSDVIDENNLVFIKLLTRNGKHIVDTHTRPKD